MKGTRADFNRELLEERYKGKLEPRYEEPIHQVIVRIFRGLSGKKVILPSKDFVRWVSLPAVHSQCLIRSSATTATAE